MGNIHIDLVDCRSSIKEEGDLWRSVRVQGVYRKMVKYNMIWDFQEKYA